MPVRAPRTDPGRDGSGKTTSLAALLVDYVTRSGFGAVILEAKTDRALLEAPVEPRRRAALHFTSSLHRAGRL